MRLKGTTASALVAGALMFTVPAVASANSTSASPSSTPSATPSQFQQVQDGQTLDQVNQEMGSAGSLDQTAGEHGAPQLTQEVIDWNDSTLGPLGNTVQFSVDVAQSSVGGPFIVTGKTALGLNTQSIVGLTN